MASLEKSYGWTNLVWLLTAVLLTTVPAGAQPQKVFRVGYFSGRAANSHEDLLL
jgi:hypothetical protein